jgi:hypothetical protein
MDVFVIGHLMAEGASYETVVNPTPDQFGPNQLEPNKLEFNPHPISNQ